MFRFEIDQRLVPAQARLTRHQIEAVIHPIEGVVPKKAHGELSIAFVSPATIRKINRERRKKDVETDVLSFTLGSLPALAKGGVGGGSIAEVLLCYPVAKRQAKEHGWSVRVEITNLIIHGVLHTLGFDHETAPQQKRMLPLQQKILLSVC